MELMILELLKKRKRKLKKDQSLKSTSILKESLSDIMISDYIEMIYKNNLSVLVVSGSPSNDDLIMHRNILLNEFSIATGSPVSKFLTNSLVKIHLYRLKITEFTLCHNLFIGGKCEEAVKSLKANGVFNADRLKDHEILHRLTSLVNMFNMKIKEENEKMTKYSSGNNKNSTLDDFERQLAGISQYIGFKIDKKTTSMSELAAYIHNINKTADGNHSGQQHTGKSGRAKQSPTARR